MNKNQVSIKIKYYYEHLENIFIMKELAVVVGYIMYYDMLQEKINGSFFSKIDKAIEIAEDFIKYYPEEFEWEELDFEETLEQFLITNKHI